MHQKEKYDYIDVSKNIKKCDSSITDKLSAILSNFKKQLHIGKIHAYHLKNLKAFMHMSIHP